MLEKDILKFIKQFPGVGQRQAERILYFFKTRDENELQTFLLSLKEISKNTGTCKDCNGVTDKSKDKCDYCERVSDTSTLLVLEKDVDKENFTGNRIYASSIFVLRGLIPIISKNVKIDHSVDLLLKKIANGDFKEVILAFGDTKECEHTVEILHEKIQNGGFGGTISVLGRGISTGAEIEYLDPRTISSALNKRENI